MSTATVPDAALVQRRTVRTLVASQAVGAMGFTIGIATASLLALELSGEERYAGLAQTFQVLGTAVAAYLLARLMGARGRRTGLVTGYLVAATGSLLAVVAGTAGSLSLLLVGMVLLGASTATNNASRYSATDLAEQHHRARALAVVVWATTIGAVAGPNLTGPSGRLVAPLGIPVLTGPFALGGVAMLIAAAWVWLRLRPDPLLLARRLAAADDPGPAPGAAVPGRPRSRSWHKVAEVVRERPVVGAAILGMSLAHAVMVAVMVMTPLHMEHGGAELEVIGVVISVHVLGMFAFAPLVGWAVDRYGRGRLLAVGGAVLLAALALAGRSPEGSSWQIFAGLFLLGLGWSCATVAAATLVVDHTPLAARTDVQGTADVVMSLTAAAGGGLSGLVVDGWGYPVLNLTSALLAAGVLVAAWLAIARERQPAALT